MYIAFAPIESRWDLLPERSAIAENIIYCFYCLLRVLVEDVSTFWGIT